MSKKVRISEIVSGMQEESKPLTMSELFKAETRPLRTEEPRTMDSDGQEKVDKGSQKLQDLKSRYQGIVQRNEHAELTWWHALASSRGSPPGGQRLRVLGCHEMNGENLVLKCENDVTIWLGIHWMRRQRAMNRPLKFVHRSLAGLGESALMTQLLELFQTEGCEISIFDAIHASPDKLLVVRRFIIHL